jgi:hypothetical protein
MCFSLAWFEQLSIWLIIVCGIVALVRLLIAFVIPKLGIGGEIVTFVINALWIVFWVIICIAAVYFIFSLISCIHMPTLR